VKYQERQIKENSKTVKDISLMQSVLLRLKYLFRVGFREVFTPAVQKVIHKKGYFLIYNIS